MDACLEDEDEDKVREASTGLRAVFYGPAPQASRFHETWCPTGGQINEKCL